MVSTNSRGTCSVNVIVKLVSIFCSCFCGFIILDCKYCNQYKLVSECQQSIKQSFILLFKTSLPFFLQWLGRLFQQGGIFQYLLSHYKLNVMITNSFKQTHIKKQASKSRDQQLHLNKQQIQALKQQLLLLPETFQMFKEQTTAIVKEWMGRISSLVYRQAKEKVMLESELEKSRQVQHTMRCEVIQLKEMINEAMTGYTKELQQKNNEITKLKELLQKSVIVKDELNKQQGEKIEQDLEIIQEESEQTTFSSVTSLRDSKTQDKISEKMEKSVFYEDNSPIMDSKLSPSSQQNEDNFQFNDKGSKKTKSFIDNFRKTIQQSQAKAEQNIKPVTNVANQQSLISNQKQNIIESHQSISVQHIKMQKQTMRQPLNVSAPLQNSIYVNTPISVVQDSELLRPKITFNIEQRDISSISNSSELTRGSEEPTSQNVFAKKCLTQSSHLFLKRKDKEYNRIMTEPSPQRIRPSHNYFSNKPVQTPSHTRKSFDRPHSYEQNKSVKGSVSKEKIKVTCKMVDETSQPRRNTKAIVYLGGKSLFRKFLIELKEAFKKFVTSVGIGQDEVKYEGQRRNKMRWGTGRLFYRNGMVYQGQFRQNMRHGRGSLYLNGISIYEGEWRIDRIQGQGYLKSMKYMSKDCPSIFNEASYCGNLQDNRLHGIGTIFLNPKQKVVTKFNFGVPVGELTYYNLHEIQFGVWPSQ